MAALSILATGMVSGLIDIDLPPDIQGRVSRHSPGGIQYLPAEAPEAAADTAIVAIITALMPIVVPALPVHLGIHHAFILYILLRAKQS
ncbi:hypothetical protein AGMMS50268_02400 [Spirochaetia bacterium]|nr:hypothetical protein AGMMS49546_20990 [Spirochaetia bacterium]GHV89737.1 hypothetical protein AGMMS50268_02400 [Spirochaetia bacterium]